LALTQDCKIDFQKFCIPLTGERFVEYADRQRVDKRLRAKGNQVHDHQSPGKKGRERRRKEAVEDVAPGSVVGPGLEGGVHFSPKGRRKEPSSSGASSKSYFAGRRYGKKKK